MRSIRQLLYLPWLFNDKRIPVVFFDACSTTTPDYVIHGFKLPCFAWSRVKKVFGGAIASIGSTGVA